MSTAVDEHEDKGHRPPGLCAEGFGELWDLWRLETGPPCKGGSIAFFLAG